MDARHARYCDRNIDKQGVKMTLIIAIGFLRDHIVNAIESFKKSRDRKLYNRSCIPVGHEHEMKCNWLECDWGMGLAGMGRCSGGGSPRKKHCRKFTTEASKYNG